MRRNPRYTVKELECDTRIMNLLQKYRVVSNSDLVRATGYSPRHVRNRCHTLAAEGFVCRIGIKPMFWCLLPDPRRQSSVGFWGSGGMPSLVECRSEHRSGSVSVSDYYSPPGRLSIDVFRIPGCSPRPGDERTGWGREYVSTDEEKSVTADNGDKESPPTVGSVRVGDDGPNLKSLRTASRPRVGGRFVPDSKDS